MQPLVSSLHDALCAQLAEVCNDQDILLKSTDCLRLSPGYVPVTCRFECVVPGPDVSAQLSSSAAAYMTAQAESAAAAGVARVSVEFAYTCDPITDEGGAQRCILGVTMAVYHEYTKTPDPGVIAPMAGFSAGGPIPPAAVFGQLR